MESYIEFHNEDVELPNLSFEQIEKWLIKVIATYNKDLGELNYIFCSDEYLLKMNQDYLNHDYFTDIITFDNSEEANEIAGDMFISIDTVKDNAKTYKINPDHELMRVIVHGLLHLIGFNDKTDEDQIIMTEKEDLHLAEILK